MTDIYSTANWVSGKHLVTTKRETRIQGNQPFLDNVVDLVARLVVAYSSQSLDISSSLGAFELLDVDLIERGKCDG